MPTDGIRAFREVNTNTTHEGNMTTTKTKRQPKVKLTKIQRMALEAVRDGKNPHDVVAEQWAQDWHFKVEREIPPGSTAFDCLRMAQRRSARAIASRTIADVAVKGTKGLLRVAAPLQAGTVWNGQFYVLTNEGRAVLGLPTEETKPPVEPHETVALAEIASSPGQLHLTVADASKVRLCGAATTLWGTRDESKVTCEACKAKLAALPTLATAPNRSWAPEVIADSSGKWCGNGLRFASKEEAEANVSNLFMRWTLVRETRVVESEDEVNYQWDVERGLVEVKK